jgi:hypothetical protein
MTIYDHLKRKLKQGTHSVSRNNSNKIGNCLTVLKKLILKMMMKEIFLTQMTLMNSKNKTNMLVRTQRTKMIMKW